MGDIMGKVIRKISKEENINGVDFLKKMYSVNVEGMVSELVDGNSYYKNIELDSILVNVTDEKDKVLISKLVSLKAFLLSKEQGMNINDLLKNIDNVMKMSISGLNKDEDIVFDIELKSFLNKANIEIIKESNSEIFFSDSKRIAKVSLSSGKIDFNTICEVEN